MQRCLAAALLTLWPTVASAQLSRDQKLLDFQHMAAYYAKEYAPYEWKKELFGFDLLDLAPWLERAGRSRDDLEFFEICAEYVARLNDLHSSYLVPSRFVASIGIFVDFYDGKPLVEMINREKLPESRFPLRVGDELISVDGKTPEQWVREVSRLQSFANPRSTRRFALDQIFFRQQRLLPRAHQIGEEALVVVQSPDGTIRNMLVPWEKSGEPVTVIGPVPTAKSEPGRRMASGEEPPYLRTLRKWWDRRAPESHRLRGVGRLAPVYRMPESFVQRLGDVALDFFFSGTYDAGGSRIGFLRIPTFVTGGRNTTALRQFRAEIEFLQANTDGLVLDVMRNFGGDACYAEELLRSVIPFRFRTVGDEVRPTLAWIYQFERDLELARELDAEQWIVDLLTVIVRDLRQAYRENRGRTGPLPICGPSLQVEPILSGAGELQAYRKPLLLLIDEFSVSSAEFFAAVIQDNGRGPLFGFHTAGGGGVVESSDVGFYSEGMASLTRTMGVRNMPISAPGFPVTTFIENIGVRPDLGWDYMIRENLFTEGRPFVDAFTAEIVTLIRRGG